MLRQITFSLLVSLLIVSVIFAIGCQGGSPTSVFQVTRTDAKSRGVDITIYNQNVALVKDRRVLTLKAGMNHVRFTDVASQIDPTSVQFTSLTDPAGTRVLEQNYAYDIVNSQKILQKYLDQNITLVTEDGTKYAGKLLSGSDDIILQADDGQVTTVKLARVRELKFPNLPGGLITKPTLVWLVNAAKEGEQDTQVTYMTNGINWKANYVVVVNDQDTAMNMNGWVTIDNNSGATYEDANLKLVAGDVRRVTQVPAARDGFGAPTATAKGESQFVQQDLFEYKLYSLQRATTIHNHETKQIEFINATNVGIHKLFVYDGGSAYRFYGYLITDPNYGKTSNTKVAVMIEFKNSEANKLGIPLPKGTVRVYKADADGSNQFIGEDNIDHTPKDEMVRLNIGTAFDVVGERKQTNFVKVGDRVIEETYEIKLRNHKKETVEVRVVERLYRWSNWQILKTNHEFTKADAQTIEYRVNIKPDSESVVNYTVRYSW